MAVSVAPCRLPLPVDDNLSQSSPDSPNLFSAPGSDPKRHTPNLGSEGRKPSFSALRTPQTRKRTLPDPSEPERNLEAASTSATLSWPTRTTPSADRAWRKRRGPRMLASKGCWWILKIKMGPVVKLSGAILSVRAFYAQKKAGI